MARHWGVLISEHQRQKLLQENLTESGVEHFVPLVSGSKVVGGRHIHTKKPLLGRYVLFRIVGEVWKSLIRLRGAQGILLTVENTPARVDDEVINHLEGCCVNGIYVPPEQHPTSRSQFFYGQRVRPTTGPLVGHVGVYEGAAKRNSDAALFFLFGRQQRLVFKQGDLEAV